MVGEPAVWPDPDPGWRVQIGVGLLANTPLSAERRAALDKEDERERQRAEFEAELRRQAALERRQEMLMRGQVPHSVGEVLQSVAVAQDRQDRRDAAAEARQAELVGKPRPTYVALLREAKAEREARQAELESTPASKAELDRGLKKLANTVSNTFGKKLLS
jgi:hypothetical protein